MSFEFLGPEPVVIKFVLNEWVSFEQPGNYRVRVISSTRYGYDLANPVAPSGPRDPAAEPLTSLRYLGTEEAARELARRSATGNVSLQFQYMFGLLGSPHGTEGLAEMRALLRDANVAVTPMFLRAMSYLPLRAGQAPRAAAAV